MLSDDLQKHLVYLINQSGCFAAWNKLNTDQSYFVKNYLNTKEGKQFSDKVIEILTQYELEGSDFGKKISESLGNTIDIRFINFFENLRPDSIFNKTTIPSPGFNFNNTTSEEKEKSAWRDIHTNQYNTVDCSPRRQAYVSANNKSSIGENQKKGVDFVILIELRETILECWNHIMSLFQTQEVNVEFSLSELPTQLNDINKKLQMRMKQFQEGMSRFKTEPNSTLRELATDCLSAIGKDRLEIQHAIDVIKRPSTIKLIQLEGLNKLRCQPWPIRSDINKKYMRTLEIHELPTRKKVRSKSTPPRFPSKSKSEIILPPIKPKKRGLFRSLSAMLFGLSNTDEKSQEPKLDINQIQQQTEIIRSHYFYKLGIPPKETNPSSNQVTPKSP